MAASPTKRNKKPAAKVGSISFDQEVLQKLVFQGYSRLSTSKDASPVKSVAKSPTEKELKE